MSSQKVLKIKSCDVLLHVFLLQLLVILSLYPATKITVNTFSMFTVSRVQLIKGKPDTLKEDPQITYRIFNKYYPNSSPKLFSNHSSE